ncbi:hypothetical protein ABPG77_010362 [Micractinium sp. CCAP 211/92]
MAPLSVVTGVSPGGIGLEVAAGLRAAGHHVILACRNQAKCATAAAELDARGLPGSCECRHLDLSDYASVRAFAEGLQQSRSAAGGGQAQRRQAVKPGRAAEAAQPEQPLAILVNNAGVMGVPPNADGSCGHFGPNHLGPYLLTRLLLPMMAAGSRVVTVASESHRRGSLRIGGATGSSTSGSTSGSSAAGSPSHKLHLAGPPPANWYAAYARSKLANVLMTAELAQQLERRGCGVTAYSVSPGRVATNILVNVPGLLQAPLRWLASLAFQTPAQGARTVLHAALSPSLAGRSELYLHAQRPCKAARAAQDEQLAAQLWQLSNQEVGLSAANDAALWPPH